MSSKRGAWISRRGQADAEHAIDQVIDRQVQLLTIGAQENLQRQDLDPVEEAQIVAWHEQVFFDKNQAELGAMLGKSSDWVSVRSRIYKLPHVLRERLRQRPRAIAQMLELGSLSTQQPEVALILADRVVQENLTLDAIRSLVRGYTRPEARDASRIDSAERRGAATKVQEITNALVADHNKHDTPQSTAIDLLDAPNRRDLSASPQEPKELSMVAHGDSMLPADSRMSGAPDEALLQQATEIVTILASRAEQLPINDITGQLLDRLETALAVLRSAFVDHTSGQDK